MHPNSEYVVLVDSNDQVIGQAEKLVAHQQGLLHRAFSIFLFRKQGEDTELLLQQRALGKYHAAGLWSNTCCSHPRQNEDLLAAGKRRLKEEMGIEVKLEIRGRFQYRAEFSNGLIEHELDYLLVGWADEAEPQLNPEEVMASRWCKLSQIQDEYQKSPESFTPWFEEALDLVLPFAKQ